MGVKEGVGKGRVRLTLRMPCFETRPNLVGEQRHHFRAVPLAVISLPRGSQSEFFLDLLLQNSLSAHTIDESHKVR